MFTVIKITPREVIDSRGYPALEVELALKKKDGQNIGNGRAIVPSGASTGSKEALELRDGDPSRFLGKGLTKAIENIRKYLAPHIIGQTYSSLEAFDTHLLSFDSSPQKSQLGGNTLLSLSMAFSHALSNAQQRPLFKIFEEALSFNPQPLDQFKFLPQSLRSKSVAKTFPMPIPMMNIINGGAHANNNLSFQEFMIVPIGFSSFKEALRAGCEVFQNLKKILQTKNLSTGVGDEGGFAPNLQSIEHALDIIMLAISQSNYQPGDEIALALDVAATELYNPEKKTYVVKGKGELSGHELGIYYLELAKRFPIISIEDPFYENGWDEWSSFTRQVTEEHIPLQVVGDDLFVTQTRELSRGIQTGGAHSILIKMNQVGTITETLQTIRLAQKNNFTTIVSHRSGETEDTTLIHLAVGTQSQFVKTGSLSRGERTAKYNELLRIEESLLS